MHNLATLYRLRMEPPIHTFRFLFDNLTPTRPAPVRSNVQSMFFSFLPSLGNAAVHCVSVCGGGGGGSQRLPAGSPSPPAAVAAPGRMGRFGVKGCGHRCCLTLERCCACMDRRPARSGNTYPVYVDGQGWVEGGSRREHYCPLCK